MARKQTSQLLLNDNERDDTTVIEFFDPTDGAGSTEASDKAEALAEALRESEDSFITIHRTLGTGNAPEEFVTRLPADKFDIGQIQSYLVDNYGGGDYRVRLYVRKKLRGNKLISIANPIDKHATTPTGDAANILSVVLQRMEAQNKQMMSIISTMNPANAGGSRMEFLQEMMIMKQLFDNGSKSSGVNDLLNAVDALKTLGLNVGGQQPEKEEDGFMQLLEKMTPVIEAAVSQPRPDDKAKNMNIMQSAILKSRIEPFIRAAAKNSDPAIYADMLCDQLDEATIKQHLTAVGAMDKLMQLDKRLPPLRPWFDQLAEHVKAILGMPSAVSDLYNENENDIQGAIDDNDTEHE